MIDLTKILKNKPSKLFWQIVQIGAGANGGYILQMVAQMLHSFKVRGMYIVADPDLVEEKNLRNQLFIPQDIGKSKSYVLAKRYRTHYNVNIANFDERYIETIEDLHQLFSFSNLDYQGINYTYTLVPVLIGAVDNNYSRQIMHTFYEQCDNLIYIDVGVESAFVPTDGRPMREWTMEEIKKHNNTGWTGQMVVGMKWKGENILSPIAELFPDILEDKDEIAPSEMSCSNVVVSEPQRLITNRFAALTVANAMNEMLSEATITNQVTFFHAKKGYMRSEVAELSE